MFDADLQKVSLSKADFINILMESNLFNVLNELFDEEGEDDDNFFVYFYYYNLLYSE